MAKRTRITTTKADSDFGTTAATVSYTHNNTGSTNPFLVVAISWSNTRSHLLTGVTYNDVAMTQLGSNRTSQDLTQAVYVLVNPAVGSYLVKISHDGGSGAGSRSYVSAAITYSEVNQTTPYRANSFDGNNQLSGTGDGVTSTVTCDPTVAGDTVISMAGATGTTTTGSPGGSQEELFSDITRSANGLARLNCTDLEASGTTTVMTVTWSQASNRLIDSLSIVPLTSGTVPLFMNLYRQQRG